jgi:hypothetical protein
LVIAGVVHIVTVCRLLALIPNHRAAGELLPLLGIP